MMGTAMGTEVGRGLISLPVLDAEAAGLDAHAECCQHAEVASSNS